MTENNIISQYRQRAAEAQQQADKFKKLSDRYSLLRLVIFGLFVLAVGIAIKVDELMVIIFAFVMIALVY